MSAEQVPSVSVLMPVYNAEPYVARAVESILNQTYTDFEFIIINDGSTDNSFHILQYYAKRDRRIRLINRVNKGLVSTLNEMIEMAKGTWLARMDADDISHPNRFQLQIDLFNKDDSCVAVGTGTLIIDPEGLPISHFFNPLSHKDIDSAHLSFKGGAITHPSVMMRAETLKKIDGYREDYECAEDIDMFLRLAELGKLKNLPDCLLQYRMHCRSVGHLERKLQWKNTVRAVISAHARRGLPPPKMDEMVTDQPDNITELHRKWSWWALAAGNKNTARKHAWISFCRSPFSSSSYKVLACALRGY